MALRVKSWVIFNKGQFTHICQLNVSCGQDSVSGIVRDFDILCINKLCQIGEDTYVYVNYHIKKQNNQQ
jgi:hypothetical protein